jgi:hypothetical protein
MLSLNGNFATLADFNLREASKPVLDRQRDIQRKRKARAVAAAQREHARKVEQAQERIAREQEERASRLAIVCANGRVIRPIK